MKNKIFSITGGIVTTGVAVAIINKINQMYYPLPPFVSIENKILLELYLTNVPTGAFILSFAGMALGGLIGGATATIIDRMNGKRNSIIIAVVCTLFGIAGMLMVAHPLKFWLINTFTYLPFALLGSTLADSMKKVNIPSA